MLSAIKTHLPTARSHLANTASMLQTQQPPNSSGGGIDGTDDLGRDRDHQLQLPTITNPDPPLPPKFSSSSSASSKGLGLPPSVYVASVSRNPPALGHRKTTADRKLTGASSTAARGSHSRQP